MKDAGNCIRMDGHGWVFEGGLVEQLDLIPYRRGRGPPSSILAME